MADRPAAQKRAPEEIHCFKLFRLMICFQVQPGVSAYSLFLEEEAIGKEGK
jgi:hypothetical protein